MIERRKIIKSQSSPPVQKFSKRKERVGELNVSNASRATHRKPNNANHRRSLSLSLSLSNARARERAFTSALGGKRERKRERSLEKSARTERESPRSLSLSNVSISSGATRRNFLSQTARARARAYKKKTQNAHLCD